MFVALSRNFKWDLEEYYFNDCLIRQEPRGTTCTMPCCKNHSTYLKLFTLRTTSWFMKDRCFIVRMSVGTYLKLSTLKCCSSHINFENNLACDRQTRNPMFSASIRQQPCCGMRHPVERVLCINPEVKSRSSSRRLVCAVYTCGVTPPRAITTIRKCFSLLLLLL